MAIIYSGDGGWRDLDKEIGEALVARGMPVVGVDSLRSFWTVRSPQQVADDLGELMTTYGERWGTKRVVLIGYSFGAGVLPFAINLLPATLQERIVLIALLGVEPRADFEIRFTGWFGQEPDANAPEVLPQLLKLDVARVQCFYGEDEADSLCRAPQLARAEVIRTAGGHHFDGDYAALAARILAGVERRAPGALPVASATPGP
jgi:type IV secretory pathway VirJ component